MAFEEYTWIFAIVTIAFTVSSFANGANDIANSYSTTVAARSLSLMQVGILAGITEFIGAVFLGSRVTKTLKSSIIDISRFDNRPDVLMVVMMCAEMGSAAWLWLATSRGFSVSTTQTTVGAIIGAGIGAGVMPDFTWGRNSRITQTIVTWTIAPVASGLVAALIYGLVSITVTNTNRSLNSGINWMPLYLAVTATIMSCFIMFEQIHKESANSFTKIALPVVLSSFFGMLTLGYVFWIPFIRQRLLREDTRIRFRHILLGPYLLVKKHKLPWAGEQRSELVPDYIEGLEFAKESKKCTHSNEIIDPESGTVANEDKIKASNLSLQKTTTTSTIPSSLEALPLNIVDPIKAPVKSLIAPRPKQAHPTPEERWIKPYTHLPWYNATRIRNVLWYCFLQGVSRDVITLKKESDAPTATDKENGNDNQKFQPPPTAPATREIENRKEHLLTYAQVIAAMMMSIAHGSNDVSNAVGPWVTVWGIWNKFDLSRSSIKNESLPETYKTTALVGQNTPIWILVAAAILMALGFWIRGWVIMSATGTKLVRQTPSRGFSVAMGTAVTVLVASRIGMPVSTTQCVIGACVGVGFLGGGGLKIKKRTEALSLAQAENIQRAMRSRNPLRRVKAHFSKRFEMKMNKETVNWKQVLKLFAGWVLTLPVAGLISGVLAVLLLKSPAL